MMTTRRCFLLLGASPFYYPIARIPGVAEYKDSPYPSRLSAYLFTVRHLAEKKLPASGVARLKYPGKNE